MNEKIRENIYRNVKKSLEIALIKDFPNLNFDKIINFWLDLTDKVFKIITGLTLTIAFVWFFPSLGIKTDKLIIILLCAILLQLRYDK